MHCEDGGIGGNCMMDSTLGPYLILFTRIGATMRGAVELDKNHVDICMLMLHIGGKRSKYII